MAKRQKEVIDQKQQEQKYKGKVKKLQWRRFKIATILTIIVGIIGGAILYVAITGLMIKIEPGNLSPIIISTPNVIAEKGKLYTYQVIAEDYDGDLLYYDIEEQRARIPGESLGDGIKIDNRNGTLTWNVPKDNPSRNTYIKITVSDEELRYTQTFHLTLAEYKNSVPIINTTIKPPLVVMQNEQYGYIFDIIDNDNVRPKIIKEFSSPRNGLIDIGGVKNNSTFQGYVFFKEESASKYVRVAVYVVDGDNENLYSWNAYDVWVKPNVNVTVLYVLLTVGAILIAGVVYDFYRMYGY